MDRLYACIDTSDDTSIDNNYETHKKEKIKINSWINVGYFDSYICGFEGGINSMKFRSISEV